MHPDASMNQEVPVPFRGLSREACRKAVLKSLKQQNLLRETLSKRIPLGRSYRSKAIIEYRLSDQWFVKMNPLATKALNHMKDKENKDKLRIFPKKWEKVYQHWLENIQDWCISRQIAWGHRIPAWTHRTTGKIAVIPDPTDPNSTPKEVTQNPKQWQPVEDVLDTWFSSSLWPLQVLGWPEKTDDFKRYFPTSALSTAKDILFFWVARMNMMSLHFENELPYKDVYFHATVMDERGKVMSKSKGNGIDPQHIILGASKTELQTPIHEANPPNKQDLIRHINTHYPKGFEGVGADALRYTLIYLASSRQEFNLAIKDFKDIGGRFITKLWNAARFVLIHLSHLPDNAFIEEPPISSQDFLLSNPDALPLKDLEEEDFCILSCLHTTAFEVNEALDSYRFGDNNDEVLQDILDSDRSKTLATNLYDRLCRGVKGTLARFRSTKVSSFSYWDQNTRDLYRDSYRSKTLGNLYYNFFWNDFCDSYLEIAKPSFNDSPRNSYNHNPLSNYRSWSMFSIKAFACCIRLSLSSPRNSGNTLKISPSKKVSGMKATSRLTSSSLPSRTLKNRP